MKLMNLDEIKQALDLENAIALQEEGFRLYSEGRVTVPPVGYIDLGRDRGDVHIKYGWIDDDDTFAVKVAGAFHKNTTDRGLPSTQGTILVFDANTGQTRAILQDEGYLTNVRTAIAGLIAAKYLAPKVITGIGILGTGVQARLQAELLKYHTDCRALWVWGRNEERVREYIIDMTSEGFEVHIACSPGEVCKHCNLVVTTTSAREPLLQAGEIQRGTHITAVGADAPNKQELDPEIFRLADLCVVDSRSQCLDHGESRHPCQAAILHEDHLVELGTVISDSKWRRHTDTQITIADLTGVGIQDIQIAKAVLPPMAPNGER